MIASGLAWVAVGIYVTAMAVAGVLRVQGGFNIHYRTRTCVLNGTPVYRLSESNHFLYAPIFALMFAAIAALPLKLAKFVWYLVGASGLVGIIVGTKRLLFGKARRMSPLLIVVPLVLSARFVGNDIEHGQINLPVIALVICSIVLADEGRCRWSGPALASAMLVKPYAFPGTLFLALERRWKALGWAIAGGLALLAALFCLMPSFAPVSWKSCYSALFVPYAVLLMALLLDHRASDADSPALAWVLLILSVILNWMPGKMLNRIALFYSAHFISSLTVLAAIVITARWARENSGEKAVEILEAVSG